MDDKGDWSLYWDDMKTCFYESRMTRCAWNLKFHDMGIGRTGMASDGNGGEEVNAIGVG